MQTEEPSVVFQYSYSSLHSEGMKRVVPIVRVQKIPDRTYDRTGINLICMRLATIITEQ